MKIKKCLQITQVELRKYLEQNEMSSTYQHLYGVVILTLWNIHILNTFVQLYGLYILDSLDIKDLGLKHL